MQRYFSQDTNLEGVVVLCTFPGGEGLIVRLFHALALALSTPCIFLARTALLWRYFFDFRNLDFENVLGTSTSTALSCNVKQSVWLLTSRCRRCLYTVRVAGGY
jgi:hypothetical protein